MSSSIVSDVRYAVRRLWSAPVHTITILATLGVGIGATTAIFSTVDGIMLRALPYRDSGRLLTILSSSPKRKLPRFSVSIPDYVDWKKQTRSFSGLAASRGERFVLTGTGEPERVNGSMVTPEYFDVAGIELSMGRPLTRADSGVASAVLSYGYWARRFGSDPRVLGTRINLNGAPYTIIGVGSPRLVAVPQLWVPLIIPPEFAANRSAHVIGVIGRLKPGVTFAAAQQELKTIAERLASDYPRDDQDWTIVAQPALDAVVGPVKPALLALSAAVALLLIAACVNVAGLTLSRARTRELEFALRAALGAGRQRILRQLVTESVVIGLLSGVVGILLAMMGVAALRALAPASIPRVAEVGVSGRVLGFALLLSFVTAIVFGVAPALYGARADLAGALRGGGRSVSGGNRQRRFQETLVVLQVALAIVLIAGATLLVRSFVSLQRSTLGFTPEHVVVAQVSLPPARFASDQLQADYAARLASRLSAMPGVRGAAIASTLPTVGPFSFNAFDVPGRVPKDVSDQPVAYAVEADPDYFATLAIPLIRGRSFANGDHAGSQPVVIIDEVLAKQFYPGVDPIGRQFIITGDSVRREIVGVAAHVREAEPGPEERSTFYLPLAQVPIADMQVLVRVDGDPASFATRIRNVAHDVDPTVPLLEISPMTQRLATTIAPNRFYAVIASVFASIALLLGAVGLYGILAYTVAQRTREIGIRIALGATPASVRRHIVGYGLLLAIIGVVVGSVGAVWLGGVLRGILTAVGTVEPFALFAAAVAFLVVALAGAAIPASRAAKTDPLIAMRAQ